jgi:hypothetical protein
MERIDQDFVVELPVAAHIGEPDGKFQGRTRENAGIQAALRSYR